MSETKEEEVKTQQKQHQEIPLDSGTAFNLKLQEFDKKIAEAELSVATLKKEKASFIYDQNAQQIILVHKERVLKAQIEEEAKRKLAEQQN
jgi:hypothetical protein